MSWDERPAVAAPEKSLEAFLRDQVEAVQILRE